MHLKPRLAAVAALVPEDGVVADIGTDHAYLPIYLVQEGLAQRVIAIENRLSALAGARHSLNLFNQAQKIELRLGDGLEALRRTDRVDTVVVAGLGGRTICRLLARSRECWNWFQGMVLQPAGSAAIAPLAGRPSLGSGAGAFGAGERAVPRNHGCGAGSPGTG